MGDAEHGSWGQGPPPLLPAGAADLVRGRSRGGGRAAPPRIATLDGSMPRPDPRRFIENMAISDARADMVTGRSQLYGGMERLFTGGDITPWAWRRYCHTYHAECRWLLPPEEALGPAMAGESPA